MDPARAVLHSLEVSTFLQMEGAVAPNLSDRFVEGLEHLVLPIQVGLFVVTIKRKFERK